VPRYLSQTEIDAILQYIKLEQSTLADAGLSAGAVVRPYDFAAPSRVSKEALRAVTSIHEIFLYSLVSAMSAHMRTLVEIELVGIDQLTFQEYSLSLNNPTVLCLFSMKPLDGEGVIELQPPLVAAMVDRLFGGEGESSGRTRELTPIEQAVVGRIIRQNVADLRMAWEEVHPIELQLKSIERNPQMMQVLSPSEVVMLVTYEVKVEQAVGLMTICYPLMSLEPALKHMELQQSNVRVRPWKKDNGEDPLQREMLGVGVDVVAELGQTALSVREVLGLDLGDVLRLNRHHEDPVRVIVGGMPKLEGRPGVVRRNRAVLVTGLIGEGVQHANAE
jgi:flagellar motor switch protein FliM